MRLGAYPAVLQPDSIVAAGIWRPRCPSDTGIATRSTTPTATRSPKAAWDFRDLARRPSGGVRRIPARHAPIHRRYPGAPRVEEPAHPAAPAVRRVCRGGHRLQGGRTAARGDPRAAPNGKHRDSARAAATRARGPWLSTFSRRRHPKPCTRERFSRCAATRSGCRAAKSSSREVVEHFGAVAVVAIDDDGNIPMVYQYRHAFGRRLWELPAGLLDVRGEAAHLTAARELQEEVGLQAEHLAGARRPRFHAGLQRRIGAGLSGHRTQRGGPARGA